MAISLQCSCGNRDSERYRDYTTAHSLEVLESSQGLAPGEPYSKVQACPRDLLSALLGELSPRRPSKANTGLYHPTPKPILPPIPLPENPDVVTCISLSSGTANTCPRSLSITPSQLSSLSTSCSNASHILSHPIPLARSPDPFHPIPPSPPGRVAALASGLLDFYGF